MIMGEDSAYEEFVISNRLEEIPSQYWDFFWQGRAKGHEAYCLRKWYKPDLEHLESRQQKRAFIIGYACAVRINMYFERSEIELLEAQWTEPVDFCDLPENKLPKFHDKYLKDIHADLAPLFIAGFNESYPDREKKSLFHPDSSSGLISKVGEVFLKGIQTGYEEQDRYVDLFPTQFTRPIKRKDDE